MNVWKFKAKLWLLWLNKKINTTFLHSGVHSLFEVQGRKEGHFNVHSGFQEGTLARVFATQEGSLSCFNEPRGQFSVICQPRWHFSVRFGSQEGTLAYILNPRRTL